jgi:mannose-6-phosphate isomerase-like protein (cupin superfamily)
VQLFHVAELLAKRDSRIHTYEDFFTGELLSLGLSVWPAGQPDNQEPHSEDEVYFVIAGKGRIRVGDEDEAVAAGSVVFVPASLVHHFHEIEEDLQVLVFWAPPHNSRARALL